MGFSVLALGAAGQVSNTISSYYGAKSQKMSLEYEAALAEINAKVSESNARASLLAGEREQQAFQLATAQLKSTQKTALAGGGIDLTSDTAADLLTSTDYMGEMDANAIKANALREAWGHRMEATGLRGQAAYSRASASAINPAMSAATTFISGASQLGSSYYALQGAGAFKNPPKSVSAATSLYKSLKGL